MTGARRLLRSGLLIVALALIALAIVDQWDQLVDGVQRLDAQSLGLAFVAVLAGLVAAMLGWRALLAGLGSPLPVGAAARIYLLSQLGKYIPGSLWPVLAQVELGRDYKVPRARSGIAAVAVLVVSLAVGTAVAMAGLAVASAEALREYWWVTLAAPFGFALLVPAVLQRLLDLAMRLSRRGDGQSVKVSGSALLQAVGWLLAMWICFGVHIWLLAKGLGAQHDHLLLLSLGGYALAWIVGFLVVIAPAGIGVREGVLLLLLAPVIGRPETLALALVSRMLMLAGDLLTSAVAVLASRGDHQALRNTDQAPPHTDQPPKGGHA